MRLALDTGRPIAEVAGDIGAVDGTLGNWVNLWRTEHAGDEAELNVTVRAELAQLRREDQTLRMEPQLLKRAAARFARQQNR